MIISIMLPTYRSSKLYFHITVCIS